MLTFDATLSCNSRRDQHLEVLLYELEALVRVAYSTAVILPAISPYLVPFRIEGLLLNVSSEDLFIVEEEFAVWIAFAVSITRLQTMTFQDIYPDDSGIFAGSTQVSAGPCRLYQGDLLFTVSLISSLMGTGTYFADIVTVLRLPPF